MSAEYPSLVEGIFALLYLVAIAASVALVIGGAGIAAWEIAHLRVPWNGVALTIVGVTSALALIYPAVMPRP